MRERVSAGAPSRAQPSRTTVRGQPGAGARWPDTQGGRLQGSGPVQWEGARWSCRARGSPDQTWAGLGGLLAHL